MVDVVLEQTEQVALKNAAQTKAKVADVKKLQHEAFLRLMNIKGSDFSNFIFAVLIIEDLFAIVLLGVLSTFAITKTISGPELGQTFVQILFFVILCFVLGLYFVPRVFKK